VHAGNWLLLTYSVSNIIWNLRQRTLAHLMKVHGNEQLEVRRESTKFQKAGRTRQLG